MNRLWSRARQRSARWIDPAELGGELLTGCRIAAAVGLLVGLFIGGVMGAIVVGPLAWGYWYERTCNDLGILR